MVKKTNDKDGSVSSRFLIYKTVLQMVKSIDAATPCFDTEARIFV